jgi:nucleotide-binding universal stress UspA family protein
VEVLLEEGIPPQVIAGLGDAHDLVVIGKRGEHARWGKEMLGTTTEAVVKRARTPVLLAEEVVMPLQGLLVLYDGSHSANQALKLVADMASHTSLRLVVFTAARTQTEAAAVQEEARTYLAAFPFEVAYHSRAGDIVQAVFEELRENPADAVCMGIKGHSALRDFILGSTAEHLMREIDVPILLTP